MRLIRFEAPGGRPGVGIVREDQVVEIAQDWLTALAQCTGGAPGMPTETGNSWPLGDCALLAPLAGAPGGRPGVGVS